MFVSPKDRKDKRSEATLPKVQECLKANHKYCMERFEERERDQLDGQLRGSSACHQVVGQGQEQERREKSPSDKAKQECLYTQQVCYVKVE